MAPKKVTPLAYRIELIRLIIAYLPRVGGIDGPYHIKGIYKLHTLPQETYTVFRAVNAKGKVKEARIYKGAQGPTNPEAELNLKQVKELTEKIKEHAKYRNLGTAKGTQQK